MTASAPAILIVDDDPTLLRLLGILLREEGYRVLSADSAERALALLAAEKPNLLLTDLRMGGMDGLALFDAVRRSYPLLPVIILTAHGTIPEAVEATRRGVFGFITKPYEAQTLLTEVRKALAVDAPLPDLAESQIVTRSPLMQAVLDEARVVAATDASVLILGDTGSGKELLAQTVHDWSPRREAAFVAINCGAIPEQLLESELFGHVKGSFTGAARDRRGLFQEAEGGTVFLDEIGDMPLPLQVKLLRVLQEREVRPVGASRSMPVDVRIVSATHRDLEAEIGAGRFREDLFYRLNVVNLNLPALAERREDIPLLAQHFLSALTEKYRKKVNGYSADAMETLLKAPWPGNVRQLFNVVEKCVALSTTPIVPLALIERALNRPGDDMASFDEARRDFERDYLVQLLKMTSGNVTNAARIAKRNRSDFYTLLNRHRIDPGHFKG
ncbi:MAG: sigma 54-interacting transcriptional regulator [Zoogloeaceae bacterium]|nr:sigma 54-interacting transcriptional regulator [Zoogloeaceae bacterium]MCK6383838.1 sigma 54-interacting transcriptional regulator [Rhodocyclaceae bacterium]